MAGEVGIERRQVAALAREIGQADGAAHVVRRAGRALDELVRGEDPDQAEGQPVELRPRGALVVEGANGEEEVVCEAEALRDVDLVEDNDDRCRIRQEERFDERLESSAHGLLRRPLGPPRLEGSARAHAQRHLEEQSSVPRCPVLQLVSAERAQVDRHHPDARRLEALHDPMDEARFPHLARREDVAIRAGREEVIDLLVLGSRDVDREVGDRPPDLDGLQLTDVVRRAHLRAPKNCA
ncbi:hypothetical protein WMF12_01170 [Sorangium sp. So ce363]